MITIYLLLQFSSYFLFGLSIIFVFKKYKNITKEILIIKFLSPIFWGYSIYKLYLFSISYNSLDAKSAIAIILSSFSLLLFLYARKVTKDKKLSLIFSTDKPKFIVESGPYKYIRHPFYTSYIISYSTVFIFIFDYIIIFLYLVLIGTYFYATLVEESKFMNSDLKEKYNNYREKTGRFFPVFNKDGY